MVWIQIARLSGFLRWGGGGGGAPGKEPACQFRRWSLGQKDPLEEGMASHASILAWRIPRTESGRLQSIGLQKFGHKWSNLACMHACTVRLSDLFWTDHRQRCLAHNTLFWDNAGWTDPQNEGEFYQSTLGFICKDARDLGKVVWENWLTLRKGLRQSVGQSRKLCWPALLQWSNSTPLMENPRDGGAWWAAVYGVTQSWTRLTRLSSSSSNTIPVTC